MQVYSLQNCILNWRNVSNGFCRGSAINPDWFELDKSRGFESQGLTAFMRFTVIISDFLIFIPSLIAYAHYGVPTGRKIDKVCTLTSN